MNNQTSNTNKVRETLAELEDAINAEGFGCACMPDVKCATCKARDLMSKWVRPSFEKLREALSAQPTQAEPVLPNNEHVICPGCAHQFRAIPVQVQQLLLSAGHEPPFLAAQPPREPVQPLSDEDMANCGLLSELRLEEERRAEWHAEMRRDAFGDKT